MQVVRAHQATGFETVLKRVKARNHDPEPGAAALAKRKDDGIGLLQFAVYLAASQPTIDRVFALFGQPEQLDDCQ